jgi:integrase
VLLAADPDVQDSLVAMMDTMARVGEINRLTWEDVNFEQKYVVLCNRKKKGGHLTTRKFPMTNRLYQMVLMVLKRHKNLTPGSSGGFTGTGRRAVSWTALSRTARKLCGFSAVRPG